MTYKILYKTDDIMVLGEHLDSKKDFIREIILKKNNLTTIYYCNDVVKSKDIKKAIEKELG